MQTINKRFWEIDFLRGIAIILMIIFHIAFDLEYFGLLNFNIESMPWTIFRISIFSLFFLLVGISLSISRLRGKQFKSYFARGLKVFFWGLIITLVTFIFMKQGFVLFGVLHFIGFSIILSYPFLKLKYLNLLLAVPIIVLGLYLFSISFNFSWLLWIGLKPHGFYTIDYFPLLPYFGIILIGIFLGGILYPKAMRAFKLKDSPKSTSVKFIDYLGKKSLLIYVIHQPVIIGIIIGLTFLRNMLY